MTNRFYFRGLCPALDGLEVTAEHVFVEPVGDLWRVISVKTKDGLDELVGGEILVTGFCLKEILPPKKMEFADDNPFGKHRMDRRVTVGHLNMLLSVYTNAVTVSVWEESDGSKKSLYERSFFDGRQTDVTEMFDSVEMGDMDPDELVIELKEIESDGTS